MPYEKRFRETLYDAEWLRREYVENGKNAAQIAREIQTTRQAVLSRLRRVGIEVRSVGDTQRARTDERRGSHTPRPKRKFLETLNNQAWLNDHYVTQAMSIPQVAIAAGASVPATWAALVRAGVDVRSRSDAAKMIPRRKRKAMETMSESGVMARARRACSKGVCVVCRKANGVDVNHKDRDHLNAAAENLERICRRCHSQQHREEERVMIERLAAFGVPYIQIYEEARRRLVAFSSTSGTPNS